MGSQKGWDEDTRWAGRWYFRYLLVVWHSTRIQARQTRQTREEVLVVEGEWEVGCVWHCRGSEEEGVEKW